MLAEPCDHLTDLSVDYPKGKLCEECVKTGSRWVHLRTCQTCGMTLCCDSSPNQHATQHFKETGHPVIISAEPGDHWAWCHEHRTMSRTESMG